MQPKSTVIRLRPGGSNIRDPHGLDLDHVRHVPWTVNRIGASNHLVDRSAWNSGNIAVPPIYFVKVMALAHPLAARNHHFMFGSVGIEPEQIRIQFFNWVTARSIRAPVARA